MFGTHKIGSIPPMFLKNCHNLRIFQNLGEITIKQVDKLHIEDIANNLNERISKTKEEKGLIIFIFFIYYLSPRYKFQHKNEFSEIFAFIHYLMVDENPEFYSIRSWNWS